MLQIFILLLSLLLLVEFPLSICYMLCGSPIVFVYSGLFWSFLFFSIFDVFIDIALISLMFFSDVPSLLKNLSKIFVPVTVF